MQALQWSVFLLASYLSKVRSIITSTLSDAQIHIDCAALVNPIKEKRSTCARKSADEVDICVYFASDYHFVVPFLIHHLSIGFSRIWIYNNDEKVAWYNHPAVLCLVAENWVDIHPWYGELNLHKSFDNCFHQKIPSRSSQKNLTNVWGAVFDIDELLVLHKGEHCINKFVEGRKTPALALNWAFFTPELPLTNFARTGNLKHLASSVSTTAGPFQILPHELLTRRMFENSHIKTISRVSCVDRWVHDHAPNFKSGCPFGHKLLDPEGHYFKSGPWTPWVDNKYPNAQLNHYWTLSLFDFLRKIHRGKGGNYPKYSDQSRSTGEFHNHGIVRMGFVNDTSFLDYYGAFFEKLKKECPRCFDNSLYFAT